MNSTEAYALGDPVAWNHPENPYGNRPFDDTLLNKDTFDSKFHGTIVVKPNKRSSLKGAGAVIACFPGGQIAFGAPEAKTAAQVSAEINSLAIGFLSLDIKYDEVVKLLGGRYEVTKMLCMNARKMNAATARTCLACR
jgi:hypothetical protein